MAKRKKHPKLPNGFGSIKYLGKGRSNPYAVHPPTKEFTIDAHPITPKAICYVDDWYKGFYILLELKNGTLTDSTIEQVKNVELKNSDTEYDIVSKIISSYNNLYQKNKNTIKLTFSEVYNKTYENLFNDKKSDKTSSSEYAMRTAYKHSAKLHDRIFEDLRTPDLQKEVDDCPRKHATKELMVNLYHKMYKYARIYDIQERDYSIDVQINTPDDDDKGVPFTPEELEILWKNSNVPWVDTILIYCYSGWRVSELLNMPLNDIDLENKVFTGGLKTKAGKSRIVPIHSKIYDFVKNYYIYSNNNHLFQHPQRKLTRTFYSRIMQDTLVSIGINTYHTPHDCRHTFSWLCDTYNVDSFSKRLLLGHSLGSDVTDTRYGHRTLDQLKKEIEKIQ